MSDDERKAVARMAELLAYIYSRGVGICDGSAFTKERDELRAIAAQFQPQTKEPTD